MTAGNPFHGLKPVPGRVYLWRGGKRIEDLTREELIAAVATLMEEKKAILAGVCEERRRARARQRLTPNEALAHEFAEDDQVH